MMMQLDSTQNPKVRKMVRYRDRPSLRRNDLVVLVEGVREIERAVAAGWKLRQTFWEPGSTTLPTWALNQGQHFRCAAAVYEKLVLRENGAGAISLVEQPSAALENLVLPAKPWIMVLDGLEKPGNVGAILRTAESVGVDAVLFSSLECDPYSPQSVRNSTGALFQLQLASAPRQEIQEWLAEQQIKPYALHLEGSKPHHEVNWTEACAMVMGSEDRGLDSSWSTIDRVVIPMRGKVDSLNVSVAAAVVLYEGLRQRS
jgi:TrmH family RNA methyltransferase